MSLVAMKQPFLLQIMYDDEPMNPRTDYDNFGHMVCWHSRYNLGDEHSHSDPNDFLQELTRQTVSEYALLEFIRSGKAPTTELKYDRSRGGWEIGSYDGYFKKWFHGEFFEGSLEDRKSEVKDALIEAMSNSELLEIAGKKNIILPLNLYDHSGLRMSVDSFIGRAQHAEWDSGQVGWIYATADDIRAEYGNCSAASVEKARALLNSEVEAYNYYLSGECYGFRLFENGEEKDSCWGFLGEFQDMAKEIANQVLPESHRDMIDNLHEVSDTVTREKGYEDFVENLEREEN